MTHIRIAYMPLATYPEAILNEAIGAAAALAGPFGVRTRTVPADTLRSNGP